MQQVNLSSSHAPLSTSKISQYPFQTKQVNVFPITKLSEKTIYKNRHFRLKSDDNTMCDCGQENASSKCPEEDTCGLEEDSEDEKQTHCSEQERNGEIVSKSYSATNTIKALKSKTVKFSQQKNEQKIETEPRQTREQVPLVKSDVNQACDCYNQKKKKKTNCVVEDNYTLGKKGRAENVTNSAERDKNQDFLSKSHTAAQTSKSKKTKKQPSDQNPKLLTGLEQATSSSLTEQTTSAVSNEFELAGPSSSPPTFHRDRSETVDEETEEVLKVTNPIIPEHATDLSALYTLFPHMVTTFPQEGINEQFTSSTDVTRHLVSTGGQADFSRLKKSSRLIPPHKVWLSPVEEVTREAEMVEEDDDMSSEEGSEHRVVEYGSDEECDPEHDLLEDQ